MRVFGGGKGEGEIGLGRAPNTRTQNTYARKTTVVLREHICNVTDLQ